MSRSSTPDLGARPARPSGVLGTTLGGRWYISEPLAKGGMGTIFLGVDINTGIEVAIKVMRGELSHSDEALARFSREVRAVATLNSPYIVNAYDAGTIEGMPYLVMERLRGRDLDELAAAGEISPRRAIIIVLDLLEGLSHAHAAGIIHRDLKPSNVWLTDDNRVKILDFGVAKIHGTARAEGDETGKLTGSGAVLGSPAYMSPEQLVSSKAAGKRADLWSIGVVLYELLTGSVLFKAETVGGIFANVLHMRVPPLREVLPGASPELERIIDRCLRRDPSERFASTMALAAELRAVLDDDIRGDVPLVREGVPRPEPSGAGKETSGPVSLSFAPTLALSDSRALGDGAGSSRRWLVGVLLVVVGAAVVALISIAGSNSATESSAEASADPAGTTAAQALDSSARAAEDGTPADASAKSAPSAQASPSASTPRPSPRSTTAMPRPPTAPKSTSATPPEDDLWETSRH